MANTPSHPSPPPSHPTPPAAPAEKPTEGELREPIKYKRPLPKEGDKDYIAGQPTSDEEADAVEKAEADRYAAAKTAAEKHKAATEKAVAERAAEAKKGER